jgi:hypothetical protein
MKKYQLDNPNNCRVSIDFLNKKNPVKFEYVGTDSAFKIAYKLCRRFMYVYFFAVFCFGSGIIFYAFYRNLDQRVNFVILFCFAFFYCFYIIPAMFGFVFSKTKLIKFMLYLWSFGRTKYQIEFKPIDVINNKIEIPLFANVFLGYELTNDFSKQIKNLDIIEHPFNRITYKGFFGKKKELKRNEYIWKAIFTFKKTPVDGTLKVRFH